MSFNLDDYEPVADRLARFWTDHPDARLLTELVNYGLAPLGDAVTVTFKASVWFHRDDLEPTATGWASEIEGGRGVNATSALENCETSAIGRALANCNYAPKIATTKGGGVRRPSREEMRKVVPDHPADQRVTADLFAKWIAEAKTSVQLDTLGRACRDALNKGDITEARWDQLAQDAARRRAALDAAVKAKKALEGAATA